MHRRHALESGLEAGLQIGERRARNGRAALPSRVEIVQARREIGDLIGRELQCGEPLELAAERVTIDEALLQVGLSSLLIALEEAIAGTAKPLPDSLGAVATYRADRFPLGLQPADFRGRRVPVRRFGEGLGANRQRLLAGVVLGPGSFAIDQVLTTPGEKQVARGAEPLPDGPFVGRSRGAERLPLSLQALNRFRRANPIGRS